MLPKEFKDRMRLVLGDGAERLFDELESTDAVKSFRLNGIKCRAEQFEKNGAVIDRDESLWIENAYYTKEKFPGSLPEHHAGAIYMQDPSAMATIKALEGIEGLTVLDSCAAPGGKTGQLAAAVGECGVVFANEYEAQRAKILQSNVERMGCTNIVITNVDTSTFRDAYEEYFDIVVCDAPCSGEGMFRKNERAIEEWSLDNVLMCAERQREILANVIPCIKQGGMLLYSTCTFSLEENEMNVAWVLDSYPELELVDVPRDLKNATSDGFCYEGCLYDMKKTRRCYPHITKGEGQYIALFRKHRDIRDTARVAEDCSAVKAEKRSGKREKPAKSVKNNNGKFENKQNVELIELGKSFLAENLVRIPEGDYIVKGDKLWLAPCVKLPEYGVVAAGVCLGESQKGRFVPHHQLFSAFGGMFLRQLRFSFNSAMSYAYLFGEELDIGELKRVSDAENCNDLNECGDCDAYFAPSNLQNGWAAVLLGGCAVGGVKISGNVAKNHYPKGLRNKRIG